MQTSRITCALLFMALTATTEDTGMLLPGQSADVFARIPGFVDKVLVTPGTAVKKGDVLVQLKSVEAEAQAAQATTPADTPSSPEMQQAIASVKALQRLTPTSAGDLQSVAPFDGVVTKVSVEPGSLVGPSLGPLLHIENRDRLRLSVTMPEKQAPEVSQGAKVPFTISSLPGHAFTAVVTRVTRSAQMRSIQLEIDNADGLLAEGMRPSLNWPEPERKPPSARGAKRL
jgi:membrane fusion protein (multidrug efflux system)